MAFQLRYALVFMILRYIPLLLLMIVEIYDLSCSAIIFPRRRFVLQTEISGKYILLFIFLSYFCCLLYSLPLGSAYRLSISLKRILLTQVYTRSGTLSPCPSIEPAIFTRKPVAVFSPTRLCGLSYVFLSKPTSKWWVFKSVHVVKIPFHRIFVCLYIAVPFHLETIAHHSFFWLFYFAVNSSVAEKEIERK